MDGLHRMVVSGRNNVVSPTAFQDAAAAVKPEPGMELYSAKIFATKAAEYLLLAHHDRKSGDTSEFYHQRAMEQLDHLAEVLGLELVARENVVTR